jgi:hypothetical protein
VYANLCLLRKARLFSVFITAYLPIIARIVGQRFGVGNTDMALPSQTAVTRNSVAATRRAASLAWRNLQVVVANISNVKEAGFAPETDRSLKPLNYIH